MNFKLIIDFIKNESKDSSYKVILIMTIISGLSNALLLSVINYSTSNVIKNSFNYRYIAIYTIIFLIFSITKSRALKSAAVFAENLVFGVRQRMVKYLMNTELQRFEELGRAEIYTRLTKDTNDISSSATPIANGIQSGVLVFFALIYLGLINIVALIITIVIMMIAISNYFVSSKRIQKQIGQATALETSYFDKLNEVTGGFKEIKLSLRKKDDLFIGKMQNISTDLREKKITTSSQMSFYFVFAQASFYLLLGAMVFIVPQIDNSVLTNITKIVPTILFIIMPLGEAIGTFDVINKASVAIANLTQLENRLKVSVNSDQEDVKLAGLFTNFKTLTYENLSFAYKDSNGKETFGIGPVNFKVTRGEIIFIIGGNGSGKSTLIKTLTGLYQADNGSITVDDTEITPRNIQEYRELFGVIFADFFLFTELYGVADLDEKKVRKLLKQMQLSEKTGYDNGVFSNINLSTGQRKRLAMISTILENKDILIFDEWAADQDPEFRKYFYDELIHDFKAAGKTVIAITHDDHYFSNADKLYKMEYGKFSDLTKA